MVLWGFAAADRRGHHGGVVDRVITPLSTPSKSKLLVATPRLEDPNFRRTVVLVVEHSAEGSLGLVLNRPSPLAVGDVLPRWGERCGAGAHVFVGGPVEPEAMLALGAGGPGEAGMTPLDSRLGLVDLGVDPESISDDVEVVVFSGYAGWGPRQLEAEMAEGAWWVFDSQPSDLTEEPGELWHVVLARQPSAAALLRDHPDDPTLN